MWSVCCGECIIYYIFTHRSICIALEPIDDHIILCPMSTHTQLDIPIGSNSRVHCTYIPTFHSAHQYQEISQTVRIDCRYLNIDLGIITFHMRV